MNDLSITLADLAHRGDALESVDDTISSKTHQPTDEDYRASYDQDARFYAGSWPNIIREARRVLLACLASYDQAVEALPGVDELTPSEDPAKRWKPRLHRRLAEVGSYIEPARGNDYHLPHLPADWPKWMEELRQFALDLESVAEPPALPPAESAGGKMAGGDTTPQPMNRRRRKLQWLANAMLLKQDHPDWSDAEIARQVDVDKAQLSRSEEYQAASRRASERAKTHTGHKTADGVEAYADDKHPDRGLPITGSDLHREYCADCDEPIRVPKRELGTGAKCHECQ